MSGLYESPADSAVLKSGMYCQWGEGNSFCIPDADSREHCISHNSAIDFGYQRKVWDVFFRQAQPVDEIVLIAVGMLGSGKSRLYNFADFIEITLSFRSDYQCINHSL